MQVADLRNSIAITSVKVPCGQGHHQSGAVLELASFTLVYLNEFDPWENRTSCRIDGKRPRSQ